MSIPTFTWERKEDDVSVISRRCGGGLRVYLERPWYSSGDGELLGVLLNPTGQFVEEEDPLRSYVTQWGLDPIWKSSGTIEAAPTLSDFTAASNKNTNVILDEIAGKSVHVAGHECTYDKDRRLWSADIVLNGGSAYFPFVRLALARFQPNSIARAHISRVVLTDFIQLVPDRTAAVTIDSPTKLTVQVAGVYGLRTSQDLHFSFSAPRPSELHRRVGEEDGEWVVRLGTGRSRRSGATYDDNGSRPGGVDPREAIRDEDGVGERGMRMTQQVRRGTGEYRVVIKEYETYQTSNSQTGTRLVYVDTIEL